jgi:S1-C subfamily serine protease
MRLVILYSILVTLFLVNGCHDSTSQKEHKEHISCNSINCQEEFHQCLWQASHGDAEAAYWVAQLYEEGEWEWCFSAADDLKVEQDRDEALRLYKVAADLGHSRALGKLFRSYDSGTGFVPKNEARAEKYLRKATKLKHEWAMLESASRAEKTNPQRAMDLYLELARQNVYKAQDKLAKIYFRGELVPQDLCKSYFWTLLAKTNAPWGEAGLVGVMTSEYRLKRLKPEVIQFVQDAASNWEQGQSEPNLPSIHTEQKEKPSLANIITPDSVKASELRNTQKTKSLKWNPCDIDLGTRRTMNLSAPQVFKSVTTSVWTVVCASTIENLKGMNNISLGSAVAVNKDMLITNYHIIDKRPYVLIKQKEKIIEAKIYSCDKETDKCILIAENIELQPIKGFRKYKSLSIGDTVYSVGSPQGLSNSLGQGVISGKRKLDGQNIIQTTAPVSSGSSGGGLFDSSGNLIGITTFKVIDGENLNFAIPVESFTQPKSNK